MSHGEQPPSVGRPSHSIDSIGQPTSVNPIRAGRSSQSISSMELPASPYNAIGTRISNHEQPSSARSTLRSSQSNNSLEQPSSAGSSIAARSSQSIEQPPSARSYQVPRSHLGVKTVPMVPSAVPISLKPTGSSIQQEAHSEVRKDKRSLKACFIV